MAENNNQPAQKPGFLDDDKGSPSSMRLMSMVALFASIGFGIISILHTEAGKNENGHLRFYWLRLRLRRFRNSQKPDFPRPGSRNK